MTMEPGNVLQHQPLIEADYTIASNNEYNSQYSTQPGHSSHTNGVHDSPVDQFRRDGNLSQRAASPFPYSTTHDNRMFSESGVASDATASYPTANIFTDTSSGSISSPAPAGSAVPPNSYYGSETTPRYTAYANLSGTVVQPQAFPQGTYAGSRFPTIYENGASNQPLHGLRSTLNDPSNAVTRPSYPATTHYLPRPLHNGVYASYAQTPRLVNATTIPSFSPGALSYMADGNGPYSNMSRQTNESHDFKFPTLECAADIKCNDQLLTPEIHAKVEKGLFLSENDRKWTCYRRNYFSVNVSFELHCGSPNGILYVKNRNKDEQVQAMGMRLSAAVDGNGGKTIELIQHTPKRDNGPKTKIEITKVSPSPSNGRTDTIPASNVYSLPMAGFHTTGMVLGPFLPFQNTTEPGSSSSDGSQNGHQPCHAPMSMQYGVGSTQMGTPSSTTHYTFERIQFKQATANNGKRRASQQYFHLIVELFADVRKEAIDDPKWIKIAHRTSEKIVVRGRSPSHYQNEGHGHSNRGGSANGGGYGSSIAGGMGYGGINGGGYANGYRGSLGSNTGPGASNYAYQAGDGQGSSSPESDMDDPLEPGHAPSSHLVPEAERASLLTVPGYRYHPGPLYDDYRPQLPKIETPGQHSMEPRQYAFKSELPDAVPGVHWQANPLHDRFQGFPSSHGWYPQASVSASGCT